MLFPAQNGIIILKLRHLCANFVLYFLSVFDDYNNINAKTIYPVKMVLVFRIIHRRSGVVMKKLLSLTLCISIIFAGSLPASITAMAADPESVYITVDEPNQYGVELTRTQITEAVGEMIGRLDNKLKVYLDGAVFDYMLNATQYQTSSGTPDKDKIAAALIDINHEIYRTSSEIAYQALYIKDYGYSYIFPYKYSSNKYSLNGFYQIEFEFNYYETKEGFAEVQEYVDENIDSVLGDALTDYEKTRLIHDFVAKNFVYDSEAYSPNATPGVDYAYSGSEMIKKGKGVCAGYSGITYMLLKKAGLESKIVDTDGTYGVNPGQSPEDHAWNLVKIDGRWYHMDVTWASVGNGTVRRNFFLLSNSSFEKVYIGSNLYQHLWNKALYPVASIDYSDHASTLISQSILEISELPEDITPEHLEQVLAIRYKVRSIPVEEWNKITNLDILVEAEQKLGITGNTVTSDKYQIDDQNKLITKVNENTDIEAFLSNISGGDFQIVSEKGDQVTSGKVGTGMILIHSVNSVEKGRYTIIILGDVDSDGAITAKDMLVTRRHILQISNLEGIYTTASDVDKDDQITAKDILRMQRHILQIESISQ